MNRVESLLNEIEHDVRETIDDIKGFSDSILFGGGGSSQLPQQVSAIVYEYGADDVSSTLSLKPFSPSSVKEIDLTRLLNLIHFNVLDSNQDVKSFLSKLSSELNHARRGFYKNAADATTSGAWTNYPSLLRYVSTHFYNNVTPFSYGLPKHSLVSCNLFAFEYMMSLFVQFTRHLQEAKKYQRERNLKLAMECFHGAIDIIEYIKNQASEETSQLFRLQCEKFLYVQSPTALSSKTVTKTSSPLTLSMVKQDMSMVVDYFGGRYSLQMLTHLACAQRWEALYEYNCLKKLGGLDDTQDHTHILHHLKTHDTHNDDYHELFQFSRTVQAHYDDAWKSLVAWLLNSQPPTKSKLYYFVLFMKHYWQCRHHYTIMVYDYYLYNLNGEDLEYAKSILTRSVLLASLHNEFLKYNLFDIGTTTIESHIISNSILIPYKRMIDSVIQFQEAFHNIVVVVHMASPLNTLNLPLFKKIEFAHKDTQIESKLTNLRYLSDDVLQYFKDACLNPPSVTEDSADDTGESYPIFNEEEPLTDNEKRRVLIERQGWLSRLLERMVEGSNIIMINEEDTLKLKAEQDLVNQQVNDNSM